MVTQLQLLIFHLIIFVAGCSEKCNLMGGADGAGEGEVGCIHLHLHIKLPTKTFVLNSSTLHAMDTIINVQIINSFRSFQ